MVCRILIFMWSFGARSKARRALLHQLACRQGAAALADPPDFPGVQASEHGHATWRLLFLFGYNVITPHQQTGHKQKETTLESRGMVEVRKLEHDHPSPKLRKEHLLCMVHILRVNCNLSPYTPSPFKCRMARIERVNEESQSHEHKRIPHEMARPLAHQWILAEERENEDGFGSA